MRRHGETESRGPLPLSKLKQMVESGELHCRDQLYCEGWHDWRDAESVDELFDTIPPERVQDAPEPSSLQWEPAEQITRATSAKAGGLNTRLPFTSSIKILTIAFVYGIVLQLGFLLHVTFLVALESDYYYNGRVVELALLTPSEIVPLLDELETVTTIDLDIPVVLLTGVNTNLFSQVVISGDLSTPVFISDVI